MYSNVGVGFKVKRYLLLAVVCTYQELSVRTIRLPEFSKMAFSDSRRRGGIATANSTNKSVKNYSGKWMSQEDVANIYRMVEASSQEREGICRKKEGNRIVAG